MQFEVLVHVKSEVLDPEARAIHETLHRYGYDGVQSVSVAKSFMIEISDGPHAEKTAHEIAEGFLSNPVSQSYTLRAVK